MATTKTKTKTRRSFTREFKVRAVKLVTEQSYSYAEAARQLGVSENQIRNWKVQLDTKGEDGFPGQGNRGVLESEVHRLRAENKRLLQERDILKKAAAFFASESM
jgi:transposase